MRRLLLLLVPSSAVTIWGVRHAHSTANAWLAENEWGSPHFRDTTLPDAPLSELGQSQHFAIPASTTHIVVSPLTRCLETLQKHNTTLPVIVQPLCTERVYTTSDTGRPTSVLQKHYPHWTWLLEDEIWWYTGIDDDSVEECRPNDAGQTYGVPGEPDDVFQGRLKQLRLWLTTTFTDNETILLISHWGVLTNLFPVDDIDHCQLVGPIEL